MKIFTGADHRGFALKKKVNEYLKSCGFEVVDCGSLVEGAECDYPQISYDVATEVVKHHDNRGILLCMTGIGHSICANKIPGARAALVYNTEAAALCRQHNDSNILVLGSKFIDEQMMIAIIDIWLNTAFEGGRHQRRVDAITAIEKKVLSQPKQ